MRADDVDAVERLTDETFYQLDMRTLAADRPPPERRAPERSALWRQRAAHLVRHDGPGCWVVEDDDGLLGVSMSLRREGLWGLSALAVHPRGQGAGAGRAVLDASLHYSEGCLRGIICSTADPRAARRYRQAGFTLHPAMQLWGEVDRSTLPVTEHLREGSAADIDLLNSLDRLTRGSAHGVDHEVLVRQLRLVVVDRPKGSGYCYVRGDGRVSLLAASNRRTAQMLLWEALASAGDGSTGVDFLTGEQEWALDVGLAAGLRVSNSGYVALRHMKPPMPYIPSGHFL